MPDRPAIGIACGADAVAEMCADIVERSGGEPQAILPEAGPPDADPLARLGGLVAGHQDALPLVKAALEADMPVLSIGEGLEVLNLAMGGLPASSVEGHESAEAEEPDQSSYHRIFISPGSKLAAVVGSGGFVRVNSRHRLGVRERQKSPELLASAYSLEDGVIEALESPGHRWAIGVQFHPERRREMPPHFDRLFQSLVDRAREHLDRMNSR